MLAGAYGLEVAAFPIYPTTIAFSLVASVIHSTRGAFLGLKLLSCQVNMFT
jgi:hypothetical protein